MLPDLDARNDSGFQATLSSSSVIKGSNVTITYRISSWGPADAPSSITGIYLSTDSVFDASDTLLTTQNVGALVANSGTTESVAFSTSGIAPGSYYVFAVADYNN